MFIQILGVTILGWANSIGDLVADVSLSKQGYSQMAFSAGFGGPLFSRFFGV
jgi:sodium/potassium/calcium exchanger 6